AFAENGAVLEELVVEFLRDHVYWRRNFHPEDTPPIPTSAQHSPEYVAFLSTLKRELFALSADLKRSVPFFSPRYVGHMASDLLLPGVIAKIITTLYNPNNVAEDAAPATLSKEVEVIRQLARMVGYADAGAQTPRAWGHLTSGGTIANYQGLRNITALKFYPLALAEAVARHDALAGAIHTASGATLDDLDPWALLNLSIEEVVSLRTLAMATARTLLGEGAFEDFVADVEDRRMESRGIIDLFRHYGELAAPRVLVPVTAHYSWEKALKILGWGKSNLVMVRTDDQMRMDPEHVRELLTDFADRRHPVLAIVAVLGSTEFGTTDPVHAIADARDEARARGLDAAIHVDAAWGGYLTTMFRQPNGEVYPREVMRKLFHYFPSQTVYDAFTSLGRTDSITIDPHKLGYIPYAAGAYVARHDGMLDFVTQRAAYVFDIAEERDAEHTHRSIGQATLEGSRAGAAVAAAYVTHRVLPLHGEAFGKILRHTVASCEYFFDALGEWRSRLDPYVTVTTPIPPDSNLICLAINPRPNTSLKRMNAFGRELYAKLDVDPKVPIQQRDFIASYTSLLHANLDEAWSTRILDALGIVPGALVARPKAEHEDDHVFILRHTLMNPWLMSAPHGTNFIDLYLDTLAALIEDMCTGG
ncbi:MAG: pyridoxal-dependent decarboxylase, partial [Myxococcota bacterium]